MGIEVVAGIMVLVAVLALGGAAWLFFSSGWFLQWLRGTAGFLLVAFALYAAILSAALFAYQQVEEGKVAATVSFERSGLQKYVATLVDSAGNRHQMEIQGDLWQLDLRVLYWRGLFGALGAAPLFVPEKLQGRYVLLEQQATADSSAFDLLDAPPLGYDLWKTVHEEGGISLRAERASVVLVPMADGAIYEVMFGERGLDVVATNSAAENALRGVAPPAPEAPAAEAAPVAAP